ncbi:response regulator [Knoellia sp. CPCC 206453]|uniref:response regulator n=1 Tax=Knoellia pratensis TaxID=3404796 RepID=UPI0036239C35
MKVLLVEDHPVVLRGLRTLTAEHADFEIVGEATSASQALDSARRLRPDVVVLPVRLGGAHSGIQLCRSIKTVCGARVVVFTSFTRPIDVQIARLAGADALVSKTAPNDAFIAALRHVRVGPHALVLESGRASWVEARRFAPVEPLTERENEILHLMIEGLTNPDMAARLTIEVSTVKTHVRSILRKLGVDNRRDLFRGV